jgi:hypothetical protein
MGILESANQDINFLIQPDIIQRIDLIIKINQRVAESVGPLYRCYLVKVFRELI